MSILGILGTIHNDEMRKDYNYSLEKMAEIIEDFKPDIICGEVRPEDWNKYLENKNYEGYLGPSEYRKMIIPFCEEKKIRFIPVDWFEDDLVELDYFFGKSENEIKQLNLQLDAFIDDFLKAAKKSKIPFNSLKFNRVIEKKQNFQNKINPVVHNIYWIARNQIMIERIKKILNTNYGSRVLCTTGAEHTFFYCRELKKTDWKIIYPLQT